MICRTEGRTYMKRVPLAEAAKILGKSTGAVRKQVQRGVLPGGKGGGDGRVYVYMDAEDDAERHTGVGNLGEPEAAADKGERRSWWATVAGVSGVLVILGGTTYVLGPVS